MALILVLALFTGCSKPDTSPDIHVRAGNTEILWVVGLNKWEGAVYDRLDNFSYYLDQHSELTYLPLGTEITIEFDGEQPDSVVLTDAVLKADGQLKYDQKLTQEREISFKEGKGSFRLEPHMATLSSSSTADCEPGNNLRGFKMLCTWGDNE